MRTIIIFIFFIATVARANVNPIVFPSVVSEKYAINDDSINLTTKRILRLDGAEFQDVMIEFGSQRVVLPKEAYGGVMFIHQAPFYTTHSAFLLPYKKSAWIFSCDVRQVFQDGKWEQVTSGEWVLTCYGNGGVQVALEYELNGEKKRIIKADLKEQPNSGKTPEAADR